MGKLIGAQERLILSGRCRLPADEAPESLRGSHTALQLLLPALHARGWSGEDGDVALPRRGAAADMSSITRRVSAPPV